MGTSKALIASAIAIAVVLSGALAGLLLVGGTADYDDWPKPPRGGGTTVSEGGVPRESGSGGVRPAGGASLREFAGGSEARRRRARRRRAERRERARERENRRQDARR